MRRRQRSAGPDPGHGWEFLRTHAVRRREQWCGNGLRGHLDGSTHDAAHLSQDRYSGVESNWRPTVRYQRQFLRDHMVRGQERDLRHCLQPRHRTGSIRRDHPHFWQGGIEGDDPGNESDGGKCRQLQRDCGADVVMLSWVFKHFASSETASQTSECSFASCGLQRFDFGPCVINGLRKRLVPQLIEQIR